MQSILEFDATHRASQYNSIVHRMDLYLVTSDMATSGQLTPPVYQMQASLCPIPQFKYIFRCDSY